MKTDGVQQFHLFTSRFLWPTLTWISSLVVPSQLFMLQALAATFIVHRQQKTSCRRRFVAFNTAWASHQFCYDIFIRHQHNLVQMPVGHFFNSSCSRQSFLLDFFLTTMVFVMFYKYNKIIYILYVYIYIQAYIKIHIYTYMYLYIYLKIYIYSAICCIKFEQKSGKN